MRVIIGFSALVFCSPVFAEPSEWRLLPDHAACVFENLDRYLETKQDPVVIVPSQCPQTDTAKALRSLSQNSALPSLRETDDGSGPHQVIVFTKDDLNCLAGMGLPDAGGTKALISLPVSPC